LINSSTEKKDSKTKKYARIIFVENQRMRTQIDRILQMALMDKGEIQPEKSLVNMNELIKLNVRNLCLEYRDKDVEVKFYLNAENPVILADPVQMANIVDNLVTNAIKYSPENPRIILSTRNTTEGLIFRVEDKGIGITKEHIKYIFDKFYRVPTGNLHNVKGFGLGLYYVKTMIAAHKGNVTAVSEPGIGTTFEVFLPFGVNKG
jgi:two-component system, OmpR family, phosphate regulon sensor histidine kinase PhoR